MVKLATQLTVDLSTDVVVVAGAQLAESIDESATSAANLMVPTTTRMASSARRQAQQLPKMFRLLMIKITIGSKHQKNDLCRHTKTALNECRKPAAIGGTKRKMSATTGIEENAIETIAIELNEVVIGMTETELIEEIEIVTAIATIEKEASEIIVVVEVEEAVVEVVAVIRVRHPNLETVNVMTSAAKQPFHLA